MIHRSLHSSRDAISDAPALYFVVPNRENIARICQVSDLVSATIICRYRDVYCDMKLFCIKEKYC